MENLDDQPVKKKKKKIKLISCTTSSVMRTIMDFSISAGAPRKIKSCGQLKTEEGTATLKKNVSPRDTKGLTGAQKF